MALTKKISSGTIEKILQPFRAHGDALLILAVLGVVAYAALLFSTFLYPPLFTPKSLPEREAVFNRSLYEKVIGRIQSREQRLAEQLRSIPQNPFNEPSQRSLPATE